MKKTTKNRIIVATLGMLLTIVSAFVAGGLTICVAQICTYGIQTPKVGWIGLFIIWGFYVFIAAGPALLYMTIFSIIRCTSLKSRILFNVIMAFILSGITVTTIIVIGLEYIIAYLAAGVICIFIVIIAEFLLRNKFQIN